MTDQTAEKPRFTVLCTPGHEEQTTAMLKAAGWGPAAVQVAPSTLIGLEPGWFIFLDHALTGPPLPEEFLTPPEPRHLGLPLIDPLAAVRVFGTC